MNWWLDSPMLRSSSAVLKLRSSNRLGMSSGLVCLQNMSALALADAIMRFLLEVDGLQIESGHVQTVGIYDGCR